MDDIPEEQISNSFALNTPPILPYTSSYIDPSNKLYGSNVVKVMIPHTSGSAESDRFMSFIEPPVTGQSTVKDYGIKQQSTVLHGRSSGGVVSFNEPFKSSSQQQSLNKPAVHIEGSVKTDVVNTPSSTKTPTVHRENTDKSMKEAMLQLDKKRERTHRITLWVIFGLFMASILVTVIVLCIMSAMRLFSPPPPSTSGAGGLGSAASFANFSLHHQQPSLYKSYGTIRAQTNNDNRTADTETKSPIKTPLKGILKKSGSPSPHNKRVTISPPSSSVKKRADDGEFENMFTPPRKAGTGTALFGRLIGRTVDDFVNVLNI